MLDNVQLNMFKRVQEGLGGFERVCNLVKCEICVDYIFAFRKQL